MGNKPDDVLAQLRQDLPLGIAYAARAGLLTDRPILERAKLQEMLEDSGKNIDAESMVLALNEISRIIAPVTIADLRFGRDPFEPNNQKIGKRIQLGLTIFALVILSLIGYFMHSLHREQSAILTLKEIQNLRPLEKLTSLRKMAQWESPVKTPSSLYDQYHQKVSELKQIKDRIQNSYIQAVEAVATPLFPINLTLSQIKSSSDASQPPGLASTQPDAVITAPMPPMALGNDISGEAGQSGSKGNKPSKPKSSLNDNRPICSVDQNGVILLPDESSVYPAWMKDILQDSLSDFCFQLKILSPGGDSALLNQNFSGASFISQLEERVSLRMNWFLPFFYGLLGSLIFLIRNVSNVRTAAMEIFQILMRIFLGGVAGIVIGWFAVTFASKPAEVSVVSFPLILAFLTGYGIDVLFVIMDRLSRSIEGAIVRN